MLGILTKADLGADCHAPFLLSHRESGPEGGGLFISASAFVINSPSVHLIPDEEPPGHLLIIVCFPGVADAAVMRPLRAKRVGAWLWR